MPHMQPQVTGPVDWWEVSLVGGETYWVMCEDAGYKNVFAHHLMPYLPIADTDSIMRWDYHSGYGARMVTPGDPEDASDWAVFETEEGAREYLADEHGLCVLCLNELDEEETCQNCIRDLSHEKFEEALHKVLEGVSLLEVLHSIPGIYEIISEEYNNEALDQAYQEMLIEYETKDKTAEGVRATKA